MKRGLYLLGLVLFSLAVFHSCKRADLAKEDAETGFSVEEAKAWLSKNHLGSGTASSNFKKFTALWRTARKSDDGTSSVIECNLAFEKAPGFFVGDSAKKEKPVNGSTKLVLLKDKSTRKIQAVFMNSYSTDPDYSKENSYKNVGKGFNGFVFFTDLEGQFINGWEYAAGKIIRSTTSVAPVKRIPPTKGAFALPPADDCAWVEVETYYRTCIYQDDVVIQCTEWEYMGSDFYYYCTSTGGGGVTQPKCCGLDADSQFSSFSISEPVGDDCGLEGLDRDGKLVKTCTHSWYYNQSRLAWYTWKYISIETAVLEKENGVWKFRSVKHTGQGREGTEPGCVSFQDKITSANPSMSTDRLQAQMNLTYTISGRVTCLPSSRPISSSSSSSTKWNAK